MVRAEDLGSGYINDAGHSFCFRFERPGYVAVMRLSQRHRRYGGKLHRLRCDMGVAAFSKTYTRPNYTSPTRAFSTVIVV
ncbi:hypothetical protein P186_0836 [Pyrobaculum ferrireducens]|uniref:Uncharacterized protein n=1 Tax=Pyrobaculum ferrireducens TaxID=1104324 RepID=G7VAN9_9CREN|nr:hypothetical protein P186_0836 [Pyrobaculum ferrireducens]